MTTDDRREDAELVHSILSGDENAFEVLYARHKPRLYQFIASKIDDPRDAEELVHDTFLRALEYLGTLNEPEKVLNWMYRIAAQFIAGWHRRPETGSTTHLSVDVHEVQGEAEATLNIHQTEQEYFMKTERWTVLSEAISQLPELEQEMFRLQLDGKRYEEIAEICGVTVSSVKNRLSRAKKKLKAWAAAWKEADAEGLDLDFSEFHKGK